MIDYTKIDASQHEFSGDEIGELLLQSVRQMKQGEFTRIRSTTTTQQPVADLSKKEPTSFSARTLNA